ncbi:MAG: acetyltransferase [Christensenella sp.]|nr:acetyltransferase [Christensenella sp.]
MKQVIIIGAGGHGKVVADIVKCCGDEVMGFLDDKSPDELPEFKIIGTTQDIGHSVEAWYFPAIGNASIRENIFKQNPDVQWYTAIHPASVVADDVVIGCGTCIMANVVINPGAKIGIGCILNTASTIDHDCIISDFVHLSPGVHISGTVGVGRGSWLGVGAVVSNNVNICGGCIIGAGAVVINNIDTAGIYVGIPAQKRHN